MRFQTIGLLALFIIAIGAVGIYKSEDLSRISSHENGQLDKRVVPQRTVQAYAIRKDAKPDDLVLRDSFELLPATFNPESDIKYVTEKDDDIFESEIFILKHEMKTGEFISFDDLVGLKSEDFTDVVLKVDRSSIESFASGFYDVYWHFNSSGRDKKSRKIKLFSKNVFVRPVNESSWGEGQEFESYNREHENLSAVVFSVSKSVVERYLQADQLGYFKIVSVASTGISLENYSTLEVDSSKEIQANDISSSYKYDVNFIK